MIGPDDNNQETTDQQHEWQTSQSMTTADDDNNNDDKATNNTTTNNNRRLLFLLHLLSPIIKLTAPLFELTTTTSRVNNQPCNRECNEPKGDGNREKRIEGRSKGDSTCGYEPCYGTSVQ